jgi:hypothetical protein
MALENTTQIGDDLECARFDGSWMKLLQSGIAWLDLYTTTNLF